MRWSIDIGLRRGALDLDVNISGGTGAVAIVGENGAGKSTLLRALCGAHPPHRGTVRIGERVLFDHGSGIDIAPEERRVGYLPQGRSLLPHLSAVDNVALAGVGSALLAIPQKARADAAELLDAMGCGALGARPGYALSGGQAQQVALARAFNAAPDMIVLDEPLSGLDASARPKLRRFLAAQLKARDCPALFVTHDARDVRAIAAHVYVLDAGKVVQSGAPAEVAAAPVNDFVTELFAQ